MTRRVVREGTYIDELDEIVEAVSDYGADYVERVLDTLMPDGRPFGEERLSEADELRMYETQLRGNPLAWEQWIMQRNQRIQEMLQESGLSQDEILNVHSLDITYRYAVAYSAKMEGVRMRRFARLAKKFKDEENAAALSPTAPTMASFMPPGASDSGPY